MRDCDDFRIFIYPFVSTGELTGVARSCTFLPGPETGGRGMAEVRSAQSGDFFSGKPPDLFPENTGRCSTGTAEYRERAPCRTPREGFVPADLPDPAGFLKSGITRGPVRQSDDFRIFIYPFISTGELPCQVPPHRACRGFRSGPRLVLYARGACGQETRPVLPPAGCNRLNGPVGGSGAGDRIPAGPVPARSGTGMVPARARSAPGTGSCKLRRPCCAEKFCCLRAGPASAGELRRDGVRYAGVPAYDPAW